MEAPDLHVMGTVRANCADKLELNGLVHTLRDRSAAMKHQRKAITERNYKRLECTDTSPPLPHIHSVWCWCDPVIEFEEDGDPFVIHKEVTWN